MVRKPRNPRLLTVALATGIVSLVTWLMPVVGVPVALVGLLIAIGSGSNQASQESKKRHWAIGLNLIGLLLTIIHGVIGSIAS